MHTHTHTNQHTNDTPHTNFNTKQHTDVHTCTNLTQRNTHTHTHCPRTCMSKSVSERPFVTLGWPGPAVPSPSAWPAQPSHSYLTGHPKPICGPEPMDFTHTHTPQVNFHSASQYYEGGGALQCPPYLSAVNQAPIHACGYDGQLLVATF